MIAVGVSANACFRVVSEHDSHNFLFDAAISASTAVMTRLEKEWMISAGLI